METGEVTGDLLAALAVLRGAEVIATAGPSGRQRVSALGARHVIDYHDQDWPEQVRAITGGWGVAADIVKGEVPWSALAENKPCCRRQMRPGHIRVPFLPTGPSPGGSSRTGSI